MLFKTNSLICCVCVLALLHSSIACHKLFGINLKERRNYCFYSFMTESISAVILFLTQSIAAVIPLCHKALMLLFLYVTEHWCCYSFMTQSIAAVIPLCHRALMLLFLCVTEHCCCYSFVSQSIDAVIPLCHRALMLLFLYVTEH